MLYIQPVSRGAIIGLQMGNTLGYMYGLVLFHAYDHKLRKTRARKTTNLRSSISLVKLRVW
jgi:hypothetical protein